MQLLATAAEAIALREAPKPVAVPLAYEPYIDKPECARRIGKSLRALDSYMALGVVPFYKLGRSVVFKWSEVDAYIRDHFRVDLRGSK
jgi:predicted DNA-binding transcriptional regulator AlpA